MQRLFIELLQVSLGNKEKLSRQPSTAEWKTILEESRRHAIIGLLMDGLERLTEEQRPPSDILLGWIGETHLINQTGLIHRKRAKELTQKLRSANIQTCILKGLSSALRYPNPLSRQCGDIDVWVNGSRKSIISYMDREYEILGNVWHHAVVKIFDDVEVEIHFHPTWLYNPCKNRKLQKWFEEQGMCLFKQNFNEEGFVETSAEFDVVFQLVHIFHHFVEEGIGVRHIVDYYYVLTSLSDGQRLRAKEKIGELGLKKFASAVMYALQQLCGMRSAFMLCSPNKSEGTMFLKEILVAGNFGKTRNDNLKRNSIGRYRMMLKHYPSDVLWMIPWKIWHKGWKMRHNFEANK